MTYSLWPWGILGYLGVSSVRHGRSGFLLLESGGFVFVDNLTWALRANIHDSYADPFVSSSLRVAIPSSCQWMASPAMRCTKNIQKSWSEFVGMHDNAWECNALPVIEARIPFGRSENSITMRRFKLMWQPFDLGKSLYPLMFPMIIELMVAQTWKYVNSNQCCSAPWWLQLVKQRSPKVALVDAVPKTLVLLSQLHQFCWPA